MIGIYIPTMGRPKSSQRVYDNIVETTVTPHRVVFVCEREDMGAQEAARATGAVTLANPHFASYSNSLQTAFDSDDSDFFIAANDDFDFQPGWDTEALREMREGVSVVGIDDGQGCFSTICLVRRSYILEHGVIGIPGRVQYPYEHNYVDTEFHATAVHRGVFAAAPESRVIHRHPDWGLAETDGTYLKSQESLQRDRLVFESRVRLWT